VKLLLAREETRQAEPGIFKWAKAKKDEYHKRRKELSLTKIKRRETPLTRKTKNTKKGKAWQVRLRTSMV